MLRKHESAYVFEDLFLVPLHIPRNGIDVVQLLNHVSLFGIPWTAACKSSLFFTISLSVLKVTSIQSVMSSNLLVFCYCLFLPPPVFPSIRGFFQWVSSSHHVAKVLEFQFQHQSFQWTSRTNLLSDGSPCSPRDSQESSLVPQFESISSLLPSLIYGQTLTSIHSYWKNQSFDYTDICQSSDVSTF